MANPKNQKLGPVLGASAAAVAIGLYIDAQLAITKDIRQLMEDRAFGKRLQSRIGALGSEVTLYHMLEQADQRADALWFEGLTWTYAALKKGLTTRCQMLRLQGSPER